MYSDRSTGPFARLSSYCTYISTYYLKFVITKSTLICIRSPLSRLSHHQREWIKGNMYIMYLYVCMYLVEVFFGTPTAMEIRLDSEKAYWNQYEMK
jgi:hypothetical protein